MEAVRVPEVTTKWIEHVTGRNWEVFWDPKENCDLGNNFDDENRKKQVVRSKKRRLDDQDNEDQSTEEDDEEEDWYAAQIEKFVRFETGVGQKPKLHRPIFQVLFVGDDEIYEMCVTPNMIRPCTRSWVKRSLALLNLRSISLSDTLERQLPIDTRNLFNEEELDKIKNSLEMELESVHDFTPFSSQLPPFKPELPQLNEHSRIREMICLIRQQIYLKSYLYPAEDHAGGRSSYIKEEESPSLAFIEFLVDCLKAAERCCLWYHECFFLFSTILQPTNGARDSQLSREELFKLLAEGGRQTISDLVALDATSAGFKRKRKSNHALVQPARRNKRRKTTAMGEFVLETDNSGERAVNACTQDFYSVTFIQHLVQRLAKDDKRWFSVAIGKLLLAMSTHLLLPIINLEQRGYFYLGEVGVLKIQEPDAHLDEGDSDQLSSSDSDAPSDTWVRFEDIESLLESSRSERVLSKFNFSDLTSRLEEKLDGIIAFEKSCWAALEQTLCEVANPNTPDEDDVLQGIRALIDTANRKDSSVGNMERFGRQSSPLTRQVLEDSEIHRLWFLDLKHAESVRERAHFVDKLVSRHKNLPPLPSKNGVDNNHDTRTRNAVDYRVQALASLLSENSTLFEQQQKMLAMREGDILTLDSSLNSILETLQKVRIVAIAEEMVVARMDIAAWLRQAKYVLDQTLPKFEDVLEIKATLDKILAAQSSTRIRLTSSLRPCPEADAELRKFVEMEMTTYHCKPIVEKTVSIHSTAAAWKAKCDAILGALRFHGNPTAAAGYPVGSGGPVFKSSGMVDLRRIEDLLEDYPNLSISMEAEFRCLSAVREDCERWSEGITNLLLRDDDNFSFAAARSAVETANQPENRPKGIILQPTRQVLDTVIDLLDWHNSVKTSVHKKFSDAGAAYQLLIEGLEIVELYGNTRQGSDQYKLSSPGEDMKLLLREKLDSRKPVRSFSKSKLESYDITKRLLEAMVNENRDKREGHPLLALLLFCWRLEAENFAESFLSGTQVLGVERYSLESASQLKSSMPRAFPGSLPSDCRSALGEFFVVETHEFSEFNRLVEEAEKKDQQIATTLAASRNVLRDCLHRPEDVRSHLSLLKDLLSSIKNSVNQRIMLALPRSLETKLDKEIKLFVWLGRLVYYASAFREDDELTNSSSSDSERIPWDVLVKLYENRPEMLQGMGDFTLVFLQLKELYDGANNWQEEVSNFTMLSLRGGKRRSAPSVSSYGGENDDGQQKVDLEKVLEMSASPILKKVAMPREDAVRSLVEKTKKFEVLVQDLLEKDYSGRHPDRLPLPANSSLIDDDGRFILFRLTRSPLFSELKASLDQIASVSADLVGETPGKATFEWICKAVEWIETLSSCFDGTNVGQLSVQKSAAQDALKMADKMLLDVPDDLKKTLSKYGIFVSTNKEGRLTVKSKKGGAHHSMGTTAIRWSPIVFEALKEDVTRTESWESKGNELVTRCQQYVESLSTAPEKQDVLEAHSLLERMEDLWLEASDLVVTPSKEVVDNALRVRSDLSSFVKSHSTADIDREYAESLLAQDADIMRERGLFLDSLVDRGIVIRRVPELPLPSESSGDLNYRAAARMIISRALEQTIATIASDIDNARDAIALAQVKASEVEDSLFSFLQSKSEDKISPRYREKVRTLKRALGDISNGTLCLQIVCGEIDPDKLVRMSSEQLANPKKRRERERADALAKEKTILTRSLTKKQNDVVGNSSESTVEAKTRTAVTTAKSDFPNEIEEELVAASTVGSSSGIKKELAPAEASLATEGTEEPEDGSSRETIEVPQEYEPEKLSSPKKVTRTVVQSSPPPTPPPPPPSLAHSLRSQQQQLGPTRSSSPRLLNASGTDRFKLYLANMSFTAFFVLPKNTILRPHTESLLPDRLNDSHRTKVDEFIQFFSGKCRSGNWDICTVKVIPCTDTDAKEYKRFYKDFEGKHRVAMFKLPNKNKLFFITPGFHKEVNELIRLENPSTTYGVLLLRNT